MAGSGSARTRLGRERGCLLYACREEGRRAGGPAKWDEPIGVGDTIDIGLSQESYR